MIIYSLWKYASKPFKQFFLVNEYKESLLPRDSKALLKALIKPIQCSPDWYDSNRQKTDMKKQSSHILAAMT